MIININMIVIFVTFYYISFTFYLRIIGWGEDSEVVVNLDELQKKRKIEVKQNVWEGIAPNICTYE